MKYLDKIQTMIQEVEKVIKGKHREIELVVTCLLAKGHILIEDNPGSGKTIMARALASVISGAGGNHQASFNRIQFTPDLLPMDLLGINIFDESTRDFIFKKGPLFTNVLLADEINRASPKVQSALLECMAEGQITVGEQTYILDELFFVMATQNPIDAEGTYPLPSAQLDRFFIKTSFGYVDEETEMDILKNYLSISNNLKNLKPVVTKDELLTIQSQCDEVTIHDEIIHSVMNIIHATRQDVNINVGASTRSGISLIKCLKAYALIQGRDYVVEDDLLKLTQPVIHHRLIFKNTVGKQESLQRIVTNEMKRLSTLKLF